MVTLRNFKTSIENAWFRIGHHRVERKQKGGFLKGCLWRMYPRSGFWYRGTSKCTFVPFFGCSRTSELSAKAALLEPPPRECFGGHRGGAILLTVPDHVFARAGTMQVQAIMPPLIETKVPNRASVYDLVAFVSGTQSTVARVRLQPVLLS